jgi:membrane associated rhomboid family serine protease
MLGGLVLYFMTKEERARLLGTCGVFWQQAKAEAVRRWARRHTDAEGPAPPLPLATWSIVVLKRWVFVRMLFGGGAFGDPATLVWWGGSFGPQTTNGEWWRLVTATFVHAGPLHMVATLAGLIQIGCITERRVGRFALVSVYVAAGTLANLVCLSKSSVIVTIGGSGAVFGVYGLLIGACTWALLRGSPTPVRWRMAKRLVPGIAFFLLYTAATDRLDRAAAIAAFAGGMINGLVLASGARDQKPAARRVAGLTAVTAGLAVLFAVPLRGIADVRPQIAHVIAMEDRTFQDYDAAVVRFRNGAIPAIGLAQLIDRTILPELQAARASLAALERVPHEHQPLVTVAGEYLRLRDESWRLRSDALRKSSTRLLQEADRREWRARDVLRKIRDSSQK